MHLNRFFAHENNEASLLDFLEDNFLQMILNLKFLRYATKYLNFSYKSLN